MVNGVVINMRNQSALITVAMLSAFLSKDKKNYLDLILPFFLNVLPQKKGEKLDKKQILDRLNTEYGFEDMPSHVLQPILSRCTKKGFVEKKDKDYFILNPYDSSKFEEDRLKMKGLTEDVISSLLIYFKDNTNIKNINNEESQKRLIIFLNYYGLSIIKDIDELKAVTIKTDQNNYHVARFILQEYERESTVFYKIIELIKGFLIYKSIYFFSAEQKKSIESKLKGTVFYFDTRLLINALGYNREEDKCATRELIKLIYDNGGKVKAFEHNKDEVAGILTKYAKDRDSRNSLSLEYFNVNNYDEVDVLRLRDSLKLDLERNRITVVDTPEYGTVTSENKNDDRYLDLQELKSVLEKNLKNNGGSPKDVSIINDVDSISAISLLRGKPRSYSIENCRAIFVTTNWIIVNTLIDLYKNRFSKGEISFAINEVDLTAILWLGSFDKKTNIPCLKLLENAYAACCPSKEVMDTFVEKVIQLEKEQEIPSEVALLMRTQHSVKFDVLELTENDKSKVTAEMVIQVRDRYINSIRHEDRAIIEKLKSENEKYRTNKSKAFFAAESEAKKESKKCKDRIVFIGKLVFGLIALISIAGLIASCTNSDSKFVLASLIGALISIIGWIDLLVSRFGYVRKIADSFAQKKFDILYAKEIEKIEDIFSI